MRDFVLTFGPVTLTFDFVTYLGPLGRLSFALKWLPCDWKSRIIVCRLNFGTKTNKILISA